LALFTVCPTTWAPAIWKGILRVEVSQVGKAVGLLHTKAVKKELPPSKL